MSYVRALVSAGTAVANADAAQTNNGNGPKDGLFGHALFTSTQDFGPGGKGGAWCGAPDANTEDEGWVVLGGGAQLSDADVDKGFAIASSYPNSDDPLNPGWTVQLNKPANVDPGAVTLYVVCAKTVS